MLMSFISSCRKSIAACSVVSQAQTPVPACLPSPPPGVILPQEPEKETASSKATKRGGGQARTRSLPALGGGGRRTAADKGVWDGPVSLSELAFEMELEPGFETELEPPRSQGSETRPALFAYIKTYDHEQPVHCVAWLERV
jgi:hypothetical protein